MKNYNLNDFKKLSNSHKVYKRGKIFYGTVKSIKPYGVFVEVDKNMTGLLHTNDISTSIINNPEDRFKVGSKIKVSVKKFDSDTGKLSLSTKNLLGSWEDNIKGLKEEMVVKGIVRNRDKYGVFVELKPNLVGLAEYKSCVSYGDEVNVVIKKISPETKKVKLSILE